MKIQMDLAADRDEFLENFEIELTAAAYRVAFPRTQTTDESRHKEELERMLFGWEELCLERTQSVDRWHDDGGRV